MAIRSKALGLDTDMSLPIGFEEEGFLSATWQDIAMTIRNESLEFFEIAEITNRALMATISAACQSPKAHTTQWTKESVVLRLLMRTTSSYQALIALCERGMTTQSRILMRTIVEDSIVSGAMTTQPDKTIEILKSDHRASQRRQGRFVLDEWPDGSVRNVTREQFSERLELISSTHRHINVKDVAASGPLNKLYLLYMRLSNGAVHTSADSIQEFMHVAPDRSGFVYSYAPGTRSEVETTIYHAIISAVPLALVVTDFLDLPKEN